MDQLQLLIDLHRHAERQGPGGMQETSLAMNLAGLPAISKARHSAALEPLRIADIGCGSGASALLLAQKLYAHVTAVDLVPEFLDDVQQAGQRLGLHNKLATLHESMTNLPFSMQSLDVIWSEGAIYNMGFAAGIAAWTPFLKPNGLLVVSEITWLTPTRPKEIQSYWESAYPKISTASANMDTLERHGYSPLGYFPLSKNCWREQYYEPMQGRFGSFLARHGHSAAAQDIVDAAQEEIALYEQYGEFYGYGFYIARRIGQQG